MVITSAISLDGPGDIGIMIIDVNDVHLINNNCDNSIAKVQREIRDCFVGVDIAPRRNYGRNKAKSSLFLIPRCRLLKSSQSEAHKFTWVTSIVKKILSKFCSP
jgi:hypothetical protein